MKEWLLLIIGFIFLLSLILFLTWYELVYKRHTGKEHGFMNTEEQRKQDAQTMQEKQQAEQRISERHMLEERQRQEEVARQEEQRRQNEERRRDEQRKQEEQRRKENQHKAEKEPINQDAQQKAVVGNSKWNRLQESHIKQDNGYYNGRSAKQVEIDYRYAMDMVKKGYKQEEHKQEKDKAQSPMEKYLAKQEAMKEKIEEKLKTQNGRETERGR